eukprot:m.186124 g.186124  ORF g.186124 m.186124 type:complete len:50 (+) comp39339_c0_seq4:77-226(+)
MAVPRSASNMTDSQFVSHDESQMVDGQDEREETQEMTEGGDGNIRCRCC